MELHSCVRQSFHLCVYVAVMSFCLTPQSFWDPCMVARKCVFHLGKPLFSASYVSQKAYIPNIWALKSAALVRELSLA